MNEQFEKYFTPVRELNSLAISNVEKVLDLQLKFIEDSTKASVDSLKAAITVNDADGFKSYVDAQVANSKILTERTIEDSRTVAELSKDYVTEVQKLAKEALKVS
jgi:phasin family protein